MKSFCRSLYGYLAWLVSAALSVRLFVSLSTDLISTILLASLAVCLEAGKLQAVRSTRRSRSFFPALLAGILVIVSLTASAGSALVLIEERREAGRADVHHSEQQGTAYELALAEVRDLDAQINATTRKLDETPAEWVGTNKALRSELTGLRLARAQAANSLNNLSGGNPVGAAQADLFTLVAKALGVREEGFLLVFLLVVSAALEALILLDEEGRPDFGVTTSRIKKQGPTSPSDRTKPNRFKRIPPSRNIERPQGQADIIPWRESSKEETKRGPGRPPKDFDRETLLPRFVSLLLEHTNAQGYADRSRDEVAAMMDLTSWQGKTLYKLAVDRGYFETCGRRTKAGAKSA